MDRYESDEGQGCIWEYQKEYLVLKGLPKWQLDKIGHKEAADLRAGEEQNTPHEERLKRREALEFWPLN